MSNSDMTNKKIDGWFDLLENEKFDLSQVILIKYSEGSLNPITLHLKSGQNINITNGSTEVSDRKLFESLFDMIRDETRYKDNLFQDILKELKSLNENLSK